MTQDDGVLLPETAKDRGCSEAPKAAMGSDPVRTYSIVVRGFGPSNWSARSPGKARAQCWSAYSSYDNRATFRDFLSLVVSVRQVPDPAPAGQRIVVCGKPATRCVATGASRIRFMYDGSDVILNAHPSEVAPIAEHEAADHGQDARSYRATPTPSEDSKEG